MFSARVMDPEGVRILARSFYRELREGGCSPKQILAASNELIDLVTRDLRCPPQDLSAANHENGVAELPRPNGAADPARPNGVAASR